MNTTSCADDLPPEAKLYPIGTVSTLTGVSSITLRAWERRYGLIEPVRKASGHRLYTRADIDLITRVVALLDKGMRISQVRDELRARAAKQESTPPGKFDLWIRYRNGMVSAVIRFDEESLDDIYNEALSLHRIEVVTQKLLIPLLVELGERWETQQARVAEEHFFAFYLRNKLGARFHHRSRNNAGPRILAACLTGERHEIALLLFALTAHELGYRLVILGADLPLNDLPAVADKTACDAIVLSGAIKPAPGVLEKDLAAVVESTHVPVAVGGEVSVLCCDAVLRAGAQSLGSDIAQGLARLAELIPDYHDARL